MLAAGAHAAYSQRIFASKDTKTAYMGSILSNIISAVLGTVICLPMLAAPFLFPEMIPGTAKVGEQFIPKMIFAFFPPVGKGLVISALFGLILSTADSFLLMVGTTAVNDIYKIFKPDLDSKKALSLARIVTTVGGVVAIFLALWGGSVLTLFKTGAAAYGAGMFVPLLLGCFWKRASSKAVNSGMLAGCFLTIIWNVFKLNAFVKVDGVIIGAAACLILTVLLSYVLPDEAKKAS
jgi:Na+/proline symporter